MKPRLNVIDAGDSRLIVTALDDLRLKTMSAAFGDANLSEPNRIYLKRASEIAQLIGIISGADVIIVVGE